MATTIIYCWIIRKSHHHELIPINLLLLLIFLCFPDVLFSSTTALFAHLLFSSVQDSSTAVTHFDTFPSRYIFSKLYYLSSPSFVFISLATRLCFYVYYIFSFLFLSSRETGDNFTSLYSTNIKIECPLVISSLGSLLCFLYPLPSICPSINVAQNKHKAATSVASQSPEAKLCGSPLLQQKKTKEGSLKRFGAENCRNNHSMWEVKWQWFLRHWCDPQSTDNAFTAEARELQGAKKVWGDREEMTQNTRTASKIDRSIFNFREPHRCWSWVAQGRRSSSFIGKGHTTFLFSVWKRQLLK